MSPSPPSRPLCLATDHLWKAKAYNEATEPYSVQAQALLDGMVAWTIWRTGLHLGSRFSFEHSNCYRGKTYTDEQSTLNKLAKALPTNMQSNVMSAKISRWTRAARNAKKYIFLFSLKQENLWSAISPRRFYWQAGAELSQAYSPTLGCDWIKN